MFTCGVLQWDRPCRWCALAVLCAMRCITVSPPTKDTRQEEEFQVSHLPGARHVEFDGRNVSELVKNLDPTRPGGWMGGRERVEGRWVGLDI